MTYPTNWMAERLLDLAIALTPARRREWAQAMRSEAGQQATGQLSWAIGCVWTAARERLDGGAPQIVALAPRLAALFCLVLVASGQRGWLQLYPHPLLGLPRFEYLFSVTQFALLPYLLMIAGLLAISPLKIRYVRRATAIVLALMTISCSLPGLLDAAYGAPHFGWLGYWGLSGLVALAGCLAGATLLLNSKRFFLPCAIIFSGLNLVQLVAFPLHAAGQLSMLDTFAGRLVLSAGPMMLIWVAAGVRRPSQVAA